MSTTQPPKWELEIPQNGEAPKKITFASGLPTIFLGANGSGKTRLGVWIADKMSPASHRISAQRMLQMPEAMPRSGNSREDTVRSHHSVKNPTHIANDFHLIVRELFEEEETKAIEHLHAHKANGGATPPVLKMELIVEIWQEMLHGRTLETRNQRIAVKDSLSRTYKPGDLSDGERVIFYIIAQVVLAPPGVLVLDEPELHLHKALLSRLYDRLEAVRPDCAFVYITHDLDFTASRLNGSKCVVESCAMPAHAWQIVGIPEEDSFPEGVLERILGSRMPVLFVEGGRNSLDVEVFRAVYPSRIVVPLGRCDDVIHAVATLRAQARFHRCDCVGIIDSDERTPANREDLARSRVFTLPVSEIENLLLMPEVLRVLIRALEFYGAEADDRFAAVQERVFTIAQADRHSALAAAKLQIDETLKRIGLKGRQVEAVAEELDKALGSISVRSLVEERTRDMEAKIAAKDYKGVLVSYANKGLLSTVAREFGFDKSDAFVGFIRRRLKKPDGPLLLVLRNILPQLD